MNNPKTMLNVETEGYPMNCPIRVLLLVIGSLVSFGLESRLGHAESDASEFFQAFASNWEAIEDFDVCIKAEGFWLDSDDRLEEKAILYRMIGDFSNNQYLFLFRGSKAVDAPGMVTSRHSMMGGFYYDHGKHEAAVRHFPEKAIPIAIRSPSETLGMSRMPDPRRVGGFDTPRNFDLKFSIRELYDAQYHVGKKMTVRSIRDNVANLIVDDPIASGPVRLRRTFEFDLERLVPIQIAYAYGTDDWNRNVRNESVEWVEIDGIQLPLRVSGEEMMSQKSGDRSVMIPRQYTVSFHWNFVNRKDDILIDRRMLVDDEAAFELIIEAEDAFSKKQEAKK